MAGLRTAAAARFLTGVENETFGSSTSLSSLGVIALSDGTSSQSTQYRYAASGRHQAADQVAAGQHHRHREPSPPSSIELFLAPTLREAPDYGASFATSTTSRHQHREADHSRQQQGT